MNNAAFTRYRHNPAHPSSIGEDSVWSIHEYGDGSLWLGTQLGLNHFDPTAGTGVEIIWNENPAVKLHVSLNRSWLEQLEL